MVRLATLESISKVNKSLNSLLPFLTLKQIGKGPVPYQPTTHTNVKSKLNAYPLKS